MNDNDDSDDFKEQEKDSMPLVVMSYPLEIRTRESATTQDLIQYIEGLLSLWTKTKKICDFKITTQL
jgi:hypothetical protein